jgi:putative serine protease PepD
MGSVKYSSGRLIAVRAMLGPVLAAGLVAGCSAAARPAQPPALQASTGSIGQPAARPGAQAAATAVQEEFVTVIRRVMPSVVEIRTSTGLGSGVVLDADGDIVTNAHVVGTGSSFQVLSAAATGSGDPTRSAAPLPAVLIGSCPSFDLAVIRVTATARLRPATFGNTGSVAVGDLVLAIGSPLGLGGSVTEGIISAVGRSISEPASTGTPGPRLAGLIQTSAAINPGNSGGALVDLAGAVIGIPTLAAVNGGGPAPGIGFAIPGSTAVSIGRRLADDAGTGAGGGDRAALDGTLPAGCRR